MRIIRPVTITSGMVTAHNAANCMLAFDQVVGTRATNAEAVTFTIVPGLIDSIAFLDVIATSIDAAMTDPVEGLVYSETIDLVAQSVVVDGYTYFFEPIILDDAAVLLGIPPYSNASIAISVNYPGGTAEVGTIAVGMQKDLGLTQYTPQIGITDYSKKETDVYGAVSVFERGFAKKLSCETAIKNTSVDDIYRTAAANRARPVVWIGADGEFSSMIIYGFYKSFSVSVPYPNDSVCSLEIEGLA